MSSSIDIFPKELINLIKTSKFVHLATCSNDLTPSVALMNYLYIPKVKSFRKDSDFIIFATFQDSDKYENILCNPIISLLFHDWISANNLAFAKHQLTQSLKPTPASNDSTNTTNGDKNNDIIAGMLKKINDTDELDRLSATIRGKADIINPDSNESKYYKKLLLTANPDAGIFILGENTVIIKVKMQWAKVTDIENNTKIYR